MRGNELFGNCTERYRSGTWRDRIVHDLIINDSGRMGEHPTFLDIGCGAGFDTSVPLQQSLVQLAGRYIGVEPDETINPGDHITEIHRCAFEDAKVPAESVHIAFAIMVLEHLNDPQKFWDQLFDVLVPGGVFWAMTVDARHWFAFASTWSERLRLKEAYLSWLMGKRGDDRYHNYPTYYKCNTSHRIAKYARHFSSVECHSLSRIGQCDAVLPRALRGLSRAFDSLSVRRGWPGTILLVRAVK